MTTIDAIISSLTNRIASSRMPVLFIGHGNPMNVINGSPYAESWKLIGAHLPKPRAIVCMSAHWLTHGTHVTANEKPELMYDFYGFPPELYGVTYPAPGSISVASEIQTRASEIELDSVYGLDHGSWTVLKLLFPNADVPVLQLSIDIESSREAQCALIERLKPLRDAGILFIGSGNSIHNLGLMSMHAQYAWADTFDTLTKSLIDAHDLAALVSVETMSTDASRAIPTDEHYRPLLTSLALVEKEETIMQFNESIDLGSVGMRSFIAF